MSRRRQTPRRGLRGAPVRGAGDEAVRALILDAVNHHQAGRLTRAKAGYERALAHAPQQPDALHLLGVVAHQQGDQERAHDLITRALAVDGLNPTFHNNLGNVLAAMGQGDLAKARFRQALDLNPNYAEAHNNLGNACQRSGELDAAIAHYRRALKARTAYAEANCNLGRALQSLGELDGAADHYRKALGCNPRYGRALNNLGDVLGELGRPEEAERHYERVLELDPADADALAALAALHERANKLDRALDEARRALKSHPGHLRATVMAARCERRLGRPEDGLARLESLATSALDADAKAFVAFEMATILDRLGDFRRAYRFFAEGNEAIMSGPQARRIDAEAFPTEIERLSRRFSPDWVADWTSAAEDDTHDNVSASPVFLIGFPRSGTTLLDQILDAHPALSTLEEKPTIDIVKRELEQWPGGYPDALATLAPDQIRSLRAIYFQEAGKYADGAANSRLVDKMPLNTIDIGLIHRLFPRAKILLALRHPCDVVLSGFMQAFRPNPAMVRFATLETTARLYAQVMGLWQQYARLLPLDVLPTRYEDLVADLSEETRRILAFLEVPWSDSVLTYRQRAERRAIATPSYHQVVQPIYSRSIGRWRHYRQEIEPVLPVLLPYIRAFGYEEPSDE